jgi:hypothetical protein
LYGFARPRDRWFADSPLEGDRLEPSGDHRKPVLFHDRVFMTLRWREMDSNFRSPVKRTTFSRLPNWIRQFRGKRLRIRWQPPESRNRLSGSMLRAAPCNFSCPHKQQSSAGALKAQGRAAMPSSGRTGCPLQRRVLPGPARQPLPLRCRQGLPSRSHPRPSRLHRPAPTRSAAPASLSRCRVAPSMSSALWHIDAALSQDPQMRAQNLQRRAHRR